MRLRRRLMLAMAVLLVIGLAAADSITYTALRSFLYGRLDDQLGSTVRLAVRYLVRSHNSGVSPSPDGVNDRLSSKYYVIVVARSGNVVLERPSGSPTRPDPRPNLPRSVRLSRTGGPTRGPYRPNPADFTLRSRGGVVYRAEAARVPQGTVILATPLTQIAATTSSLVRIELGVSGVVLLALCGLALWTVRRGLKPLDDMAHAAGAIASGDLSRRVEPAGPDTEVGRLGAALNAMLAQIERAFAEKSASEARLRQFVADASHELRTPLTSIRGYAELLAKGALSEERERYRALRRIEHEAARMGGLVDDLLLLARLDQGRPLERAPVDLRKICADALRDAHVADPDRPVELVAPGPVIVAGDLDRLAQVVHNLVRNALVHTPRAAPVRVEVGVAGEGGVLRVVDGGPGLTTAQLEQVFDRFYRADPSRTGAGSGLGLSIVRAIAESLGGRAWAEPAPGGGTVFGVEVPVYEEERDGAGRAAGASAGPARDPVAGGATDVAATPPVRTQPVGAGALSSTESSPATAPR